MGKRTMPIRIKFDRDTITIKAFHKNQEYLMIEVLDKLINSNIGEYTGYSIMSDTNNMEVDVSILG